MSLFEDLQTAIGIAHSVKHLPGRVYSDLAIVIDNADPKNMGRLKVRYGNGQDSPDWILFVAPCFGFYPALTPIGCTVLVLYIQGDPAKPVVTGVIVNAKNPPTAGEGLRIVQSDVKISVTGDLSVNTKSITTLGAKDTRNDTLISKGWT